MALHSCLTHFSFAAALAAVVTTANADSARFTLHETIDGSSHHTAVTYLIPKGWKTDDKVFWDLSRRTAPLEFVLSTTSANGQFAVTYVNTLVFKYARLAAKGNTGKVAPPQPTHVIIEAFKAGHPGVDVEVLDRQEVPATSLFKESEVNRTRALKCSVKLRYTLKGVPMVAKSGFDFDSYESGTPWGFAHGYADGYWMITNASSISGPESQFPKAMNLGAVVLSSRRFNPQFFQQYLEVVQLIIRDMQQANQNRLNEQFAELQQHFHDLSAANKRKFDDQMAAKDKFTRDFCDYALDRERYSDGKTEFVMPIGYKYAGKNEAGEYIVTNDPTYNRSKDWEELKKVN